VDETGVQNYAYSLNGSPKTRPIGLSPRPPLGMPVQIASLAGFSASAPTPNACSEQEGEAGGRQKEWEWIYFYWEGLWGVPRPARRCGRPESGFRSCTPAPSPRSGFTRSGIGKRSGLAPFAAEALITNLAGVSPRVRPAESRAAASRLPFAREGGVALPTASKILAYCARP